MPTAPETIRIGVIGLSHLGAVVSAGLASLGFSVTAVDSDEAAVVAARAGLTAPAEPGLAALQRSQEGRLNLTTVFTALSECDLVCLAKDTPTDPDTNEVLLAAVDLLVDAAIPHLRSDSAFVVMSQVPVGYTRAIAARARAVRPSSQISWHYCVETIIVGQALERFLHPQRVMIGSADPTAPLDPRVAAVICRFSCPIFHMRLESAELAKAAVNLFLAASVTYANTLADVCEVVGADCREIVPALRLDPRIGPEAYLRPGLGLSGGHLERDIAMVERAASSHGLPAPLLAVMREVNAARYRWLSETVEKEIFARSEHPTIALWGLAYKKNSDSTFRAPSTRFLREFSGRARIVAYDPVVSLPLGSGAVKAADKYEALRDADAVVILCDWDEFAKLDYQILLQLMRRPCIIDAIGGLSDNPPSGIRYRRMGVPAL